MTNLKRFLMKIFITVASSRSGHEFFHSLLDGHSQILQFPGFLVVNKNFSKIFDLNQIYKIPEEFIYHHPHFFNSKMVLAKSYQLHWPSLEK